MYGLKFSCIVDMPVEKGIAKVVKMPFTEAGGLLEYEKKAETASSLLEDYDAVYVHLKGPDEFGHDGDAWGKKRSIEDIDKRFFGSLLDVIDDAAVIISGDHSTPCIKKGHSADPIPLLVSSKSIESNGSNRFTESYAKKGSLGTLFGYQVLTKAIEILRS
jgi:2,3-bisphosphoglycerate-independent phosphoglycerate mutase